MIPRNLTVTVAILVSLAMWMSLYIWQLRRREAFNAPVVPPQQQHVTPPGSGPIEKVTVVVAHDDPGDLRPESISIPVTSTRQQRAEDILRGLLTLYQRKDSPHPIAADAEIRDVYLVDPGLAVIDVNTSFADGQTSGVLAEELTMVSMIQTLSLNVASVNRVKFLVNGKERETMTGHVDLSSYYDVAEMMELAKQLSAQ